MIDNSPPVADIIGDIQRLLNDDYGIGFPILKELVQNANDAKANYLKISYTDGFPSADHPLLKNHPSLLIYNDGGFSEKDAQNIKKISGKGKAKDETVVGRFGVGMKSIFHLCDMFFYITTFTDGTKRGEKAVATFNPWQGNPDGHYSEWDNITPNDGNAFLKYYEQNCKNAGFVLVIPLKLQEENVHISRNNIFPDGTGNFFGPSDELDDKLYQTLAAINTTSPHEPALETIELQLKGYKEKIYSINDVKYAKVKSNNDDYVDLGNRITHQSRWPSDNKKPTVKTSCIIIRLPHKTDSPVVKIGHSVFLPLEDEKKESIKTTYSYSLILHGEFAIDSGRKNISHVESLLNTEADFQMDVSSDNEAFEQWNQFLAQKCLYPLIPEILFAGLKKDVIEQSDIIPLFTKLRQYYDSKNATQIIASKKSIAKTFSQEKIEWNLFPSDGQVYLFPDFKAKQNPVQYFSEDFINRINQGSLVLALQDNTSDAYFMKSNGLEEINSILKAFQYRFLQNDNAKFFLKSYIELIKKQSQITPDIIEIFVNSCIDTGQNGFFESFFVNNIDHNQLSQNLAIFAETAIFPLQEIDGSNDEPIIWKTHSEIVNLDKQSLVFSTRTKSLELFKILSGRSAFVNQSKWLKIGINTDAVNLIKINIEQLPDSIQDVDLNNYKDEIKSLLNSIDNPQFYRLPIHKILNGTGLHRIKNIENTYRGNDLADDRLFPENFILLEDMVFITSNPNSDINDREILRIKKLDKKELVRIFFEGRESINSDDEVAWILKDFDKNAQDELRAILQNKAWIPVFSGNGNRYIPSRNIYTQDIVNVGTVRYLKDLLNLHDIYTVSDIDPNYRESIKDTGLLVGVNTISGFLEKIASILSEPQRDNLICEFDINTPEKLESYKNILSKHTTQTLFKITAELLNDRNFNLDKIYTYFYLNLKLPRSKDDKDYYIDCLKFLNNETLNETAIDIFNTWLSGLINSRGFTTSLFREFKFPSASNMWTNPSDILLDIDEEVIQLNSGNRLNTSTNTVLSRNKENIEFLPPPETHNTNLLRSTSEIDEIFDYFSRWLNRGVNKKLLGFMLYILRGNFQSAAIKKGFLNHHDIEIIKANLDYRRPSGNVWNKDLKIEILFTQGKGFSVEINEVNQMLRTSLSGEQRSFSEKFDKKISGYAKIAIEVTSSLDGLGDNEIKYLIKKVFALAYHQWEIDDIHFHPDYEKIYSKLLEANRLYLEQTQNILFDEIFFSLKHLSLSTNQKFINIVERYRNCNYESDGERKRQGQEQCVAEIRNLILTDKDAQSVFRNSVVRHLRNSQYDEFSIPFELFQNADDALTERIQEQGQMAGMAEKKFVVETTQSKITFKHFGRKINQQYSLERNRSYKFDLENMLRIYSSYKNNDKVTGKFGLGFKSVYFVCDEPIIRTDEYQLKIIAGFYPEQTDYIDINDNETRIELCLNDGIDKDTVLSEFNVNVPFQAVFSKSIKTIIVDHRQYEWSPDPVKTKEVTIDNNLSYKIEFGTLENAEYLLLTIHGNVEAELLFRYDSESQSVIPIDDDDISKIWHTTPLNNDKTLDFAINAKFQIDIGRKTIVTNDANNKLIENIGTCIGRILSDIDVSVVKIESVFDLIIPAQGKGGKVLQLLPKKAIEVFYDKTGLLPTGNGSLFKPNDNILLFHCPEKRDFKIHNGCNNTFFASLKKFIGSQEYFNNAYFITHFARESWHPPYNESNSISINDIFILLNYLKELNLTPEILEEFISITSVLDFKITNLLLNCKLCTKEDCWISLDSLGKNDEPRDVLNEKYSDNAIEFIKKYFGHQLRRTSSGFDDFNIVEEQNYNSRKQIVDELFKKYSEEELKNILNLDYFEEEFEYEEDKIGKEFPRKEIRNQNHLDNIQQTAKSEYANAPKVEYKPVLRRIRTSRLDDRAHLRHSYEGFCQMCEKPFITWRVAEIFKMPEKEMELMNLSLCPNCASIYTKIRNNKKTMIEFANKIRSADPYNEAPVPLEPNYKIRFTMIHLAEIQTILNLDKSIPSQNNEEII
jgi:hypothetical protein